MADEIVRKISIDAGDSQAKLEALAASEKQLAGASAASGAADAQAATQVQTRAQKMNEMREHLIALIEQEKIEKEQTLQGNTGTVRNTEATENRRREMDKLASAIGEGRSAEQEAADMIAKHTAGAKEGGKALEGMGQSFTDLATDIVGFTTVAGGLILFFDRLIESANKRHDAVVGVGKDLADIAAIKGGALADQIHAQIDAAAKRYQLSPDQAKGIQAGTLAEIQANPKETPRELQAAIGRLAKLEAAMPGAAPGQSGQELLQALGDVPGISKDQAVDVAAKLLTEGWDPQTVTQLMRRTGTRGGKDFLALMSGIRPALPAELSRQLPTLLDPLQNQGMTGMPSEAAMMAGITPDMTDTQRLETLAQDAGSGGFNRNLASNVVGNNVQMMAILDAIAAAQAKGAIAAAAKALATPDAATSMIEAGGQSASVAAARRQAARDQEVERAKERSALGGLGEDIDIMETTVEKQIFDPKGLSAENRAAWIAQANADRARMGLPPLNADGSIPAGGAPGVLGALMAPLVDSSAPAQPATSVTNITNIGTVFNQGDPTTRDSGRRDYPQ